MVVRVVWWCVCVVCGEAWHAGKSPVCRFKTPPYVQDGSVCTGNRPACVEHAGLLPVHTEAS